MSSIKYAETIQKAIFPKRDYFDHVFKQHFIINRAKENLSGDFYYLKLTPKNVLVALGDCTGHGVPGAMLSVLGISLLNETVRRDEVSTPGEVLDLLKYHMNSNFEDSENGDGMDLALVAISRETGLIQYSGSYISLYVMRNGELTTLKATKSSIGKTPVPTSIEFEDHTFQMEEGDRLYMFSDGFPDQFGTDGGRVRKFSRRRLLKVIQENADKPMVEQKQLLIDALEEWKQNEEQTDDITVMGLQWK